METQEFDPSALAAFAEQLDPSDLAESEDFSTQTLIPVGDYLNPSRSIGRMTKKFNEKAQKEVVSVELRLAGGLHDTESGALYGAGKFPETYWINSWTSAGLQGQGETSSLARYMNACGFETAGKTVQELIVGVPETINTPVTVFVSRTDKRVATGEADQNGKKVYSGGKLKLKQFLTGGILPNGKPEYANKVTVDGVTYLAAHKVQSVKAVR